MSAGTCKLHAAAYRGANGYNPHFVGWGEEDKEFYHRLSVLNFDVQEWHRSDEAKDAVMANLEWPTISEAEAFNRSKSYFGHGGLGPRFVPYASQTRVISRCDKKDFFSPVYQWRNARIWEEIYAMPLSKKLAYIQQNGVNLVDLTKIVVRERTRNFVWVAYETSDVLGSALQCRQ
jgi:N-terminal domain of galactosyltransferase